MAMQLKDNWKIIGKILHKHLHFENYPGILSKYENYEEFKLPSKIIFLEEINSFSQTHIN